MHVYYTHRLLHRPRLRSIELSEAQISVLEPFLSVGLRIIRNSLSKEKINPSKCRIKAHFQGYYIISTRIIFLFRSNPSIISTDENNLRGSDSYKNIANVCKEWVFEGVSDFIRTTHVRIRLLKKQPEELHMDDKMFRAVYD